MFASYSTDTLAVVVLLNNMMPLSIAVVVMTDQKIVGLQLLSYFFSISDDVWTCLCGSLYALDFVSSARLDNQTMREPWCLSL